MIRIQHDAETHKKQCDARNQRERHPGRGDRTRSPRKNGESGASMRFERSSSLIASSAQNSLGFGATGMGHNEPCDRSKSTFPFAPSN